MRLTRGLGIVSQEVWLGNDELVNMYEKRLGEANYMMFKLARTNNRGDGEPSVPHFSSGKMTTKYLVVWVALENVCCSCSAYHRPFCVLRQNGILF